MEHLTRSRNAMVLAVVGAGLFVLGDLLSVVAYAILSPGHFGTFNDLGHAADWLRFSAAVVVFLGVAAAGWELVLEGRLVAAIEISVAAVGTLLIAIGSLINAASPRSQTAADVVAATGIAVWGFLLLSRAARRSLLEQQRPEPGRPAQAPIWLGAAVGVLILAVGAGLPTNVDNRGLSVTSGVLMAVGTGILAGALVVARSDRLLVSRPMPFVLVGLAILTVAFLANAIVAGIVFGPNGTLTGLRVGVSLATAIELAGVAVLGLAAWIRVTELVRVRAQERGPLAPPPRHDAPFGTVPPAGTGTVPFPAGAPGGPAEATATTMAPAGETTLGSPADATALLCPACGAPLAPGGRFCSQCGRALT